MTRIKYSNGMYKTTSRIQDDVSREIFRSFIVKVTMSLSFDHVSGNCGYRYYDQDDNCVLSIVITRKGEIIKPS